MSAAIAHAIDRLPGGTLAVAAACAVAVGALIALDPVLSRLVPVGVWRWLWLDEAPLRLAVAVSVLAVAGLTVLPWLVRGGARAHRAGVDAPRIAILALLVGTQIGGIKAGPIDALDLLIPALLAILLFRELGPRARGVLLPGAVFFGLALLVIEIPHFFRASPVTSLLGLARLARYVLLALLIVNLIRDRATLRFALGALAGVAVASALLGIAQSLLFWIAGIPIVFHDDVQEAFKDTPFGFLLRATGLNATAQQLSGFLLLALPVLLHASTEAATRRRRFVIGTGIAILLVALVLTWNYGAMVAAGALLLLFPFVRWPRLSIHLAIAYVLTALAVYYSGLGALIWTFVEKTLMTGVGQRLTLLGLGFEKLARDPWVGEGLGGFGRYSGNYWHRDVHNAPMRAWTELGFPGLLVFTALVVTSLTQVVLLSARGDDPWRRTCRVLLLASIGMLVFMQTEPMLDSSILWTLFALVQVAVLLEPWPNSPPRRSI
jgi:hypothetical protein